MKKNIKLYIHHNHFEAIPVSRPASLLQGAGEFFGGFGYMLYQACYITGTVVLHIIVLPGRIVHALVRLPSLKQRLVSLHHQPQFRKSLAVFCLLTFGAGGLMYGANTIASGQEMKGRVLGTSDVGLRYLQEATAALEAQDINRAQSNFTKALEQFETTEAELNETGVVLQGVLAVIPQSYDADKLLEAIQLITEVGIDGTKAFTLLQHISVSPEGISGEIPPKESIPALQTIIATSVAKLTRASELLGAVRVTSLPQDKHTAFIAARDFLVAMQGSMQTLQETFDLLATILMGNKSLLFVFQNNNELRPTGGFLGTVGTTKLHDGKITKLDIRSVYDFDGQLQDFILPPQPMFAVNNRWYLRDSNWFADFPLSANQIISMYEKEGGETPDLVVALTPDVVIDLLKLTGPVVLPQHNVTLTSDNFIETVQAATSVHYDKIVNQPKQVLADFFPALMQKLNEQENGLMLTLTTLQSHVRTKNIMLYANSKDLQKQIEAFNWGGKIAASDRDYLSIVHANLGGTKTDRSLLKSVKLSSNIDSNGGVTNTLEYTIKNPLPNQNGLENNSFIRFLVPEGAKLTSATGFSDVILPTISGNEYQTDTDVTQWESTLTKSGNTFIGKESGKTFFGGWVKVAGGESKIVTLTYTLPFQLNSQDRHSLLVQKQSGSESTLVYTLAFPGRSAIWNNISGGVFGEGTMTYQIQVQSDQLLGLVLKK